MSDPLEQLRSLVVQSAETSRLLGVDFIPVYHSGVLGVERAVELAPPVPAVPAVIESTQPVPVALPAPVETVKPNPARSVPPVARSFSQPPKPGASLPPRAPEPALISGGGIVGLSGFPRVPAAEAASRSPGQRTEAMETLRARYESDAPHQHFVTDHHSIVWGEGDLGARLMFIGEAPGEDEDKSGRPFVGRAGQLLDKMIAGMGLKREQVYIANVLKTRPPGNATPTESESSLCAPYLIEQIAIVGPEVIVTLGLPATRVILRSMATMGSLRGTWANLTLPDGRLVEVMPTYHPAYVLRSYTEEVRGKVWSDLKLVKARLGIE